MFEMLRSATLAAATLTTGLMAGLFYAYACSVMLGLGRTDDRTFVDAMQWINVKIINGWFLVPFLGAPILIVLTGVLILRGDGRSALPWIVAAFVLYGMTLAITFAVNVPLNNRLAAAGAPDDIADLAAVREAFETTWNRWNIARAGTSTAAFGCLVWALVLPGSTG
ncbi:DUF1772 domain-containing protein [Streptosporangium sp. NBC_01639]|uniref:anthrone oxygenase family protein n=1 Tax=Streptosporangium sp. NBC_01639 TaxID=2975948 RepID=UPI00386CE366|nr:DUF1772 domain-containing protein [Streptosporangium sp. NBC_01639]